MKCSPEKPAWLMGKMPMIWAVVCMEFFLHPYLIHGHCRKNRQRAIAFPMARPTDDEQFGAAISIWHGSCLREADTGF